MHATIPENFIPGNPAPGYVKWQQAEPNHNKMNGLNGSNLNTVESCVSCTELNVAAEEGRECL